VVRPQRRVQSQGLFRQNNRTVAPGSGRRLRVFWRGGGAGKRGGGSVSTSRECISPHPPDPPGQEMSYLGHR